MGRNDECRRKKRRDIVIRVEAIETPRGLVPSVAAIENLVDAVNSILSEVFDAIGEILSLVENNSRCMKKIVTTLESIKIRLDMIESSISEVRAKVASSEVFVEEPQVREKRDIKKELLEMIKSNE